jgi:hypothetical protein
MINVVRALSYSFRAICDILIGINFGLYLKEYEKIGILNMLLFVVIF